MQNAKYAITDTCLALTIFRQELDMKVVALFTALLFVKIFHWLAEMRVENVNAPRRDVAMRGDTSGVSNMCLVLLHCLTKNRCHDPKV